MIVLTINQKDSLLLRVQNNSELLKSRSVDLIPVAIKNDLFILPEIVLNNPSFTEVFDGFTDYEVREVLESEFIKSENIINN